MRLLVEIFLLGALVYLGWDKPYRAWLPASIVGVAPNQRQTARPSSAKVGARTVGAPQPNQPVYNASHSFTGHIIYADENGRKYWLDGAGKRHYEP